MIWRFCDSLDRPTAFRHLNDPPKELYFRCSMPIENVPFPRWLRVIGRWALPGTFLLALDLTYERTLLTWSHGEQMIGFSISHLLGPIVLLAWVSVLAAHIFLLAVILLFLWCYSRRRSLKEVPWIEMGVLLVCIVAIYIPDRSWKRVMVNLRGPGPHAAQTLVYAAHDGDRSTVELLLKKGVPIDILNQTSTALNGACAGRQIEIARFLLSKGADLNRAPDCQPILNQLN